MRRAFIGVLVAVFLAGCAPSAKDDGKPFIVPQVGPAKIDVDTPELRAQKRDVGVQACDLGTGHNDLPAAELPCLGGGRTVDVSTLQGPMLINLWAAWCTNCRIEMPIYQEFAERYADQVPVIGIDYNDLHPDEALDLLKETGATFPQLADPQSELGGAALGHLSPDRYLPVLVLVGADGRIDVDAGRIQSMKQLEDLVRDHLGIDLS